MKLNYLYNENCMDTISRIPDKYVDLVVTSPPYNMRTRIRDGKYTTRETAEHFSKKYDHFSDDHPIEDFYVFHKAVLKELLRVSKVVCYNFQIVTGSKEAFFRIIGDFSRDIKDIIVWDKGNGQPAMHEKVLNSCYELVLVLEDDNKAGRMIQNACFGRGRMDNILRVGRKQNGIDGHSAVFPEKLAGSLIMSFSKEGDIVYDPFMGSGTTGVAAVKLNRRWIGSEISAQYCDYAIKRIQSEIGLFYNNAISLGGE